MITDSDNQTVGICYSKICPGQKGKFFFAEPMKIHVLLGLNKLFRVDNENFSPVHEYAVQEHYSKILENNIWQYI